MERLRDLAYDLWWSWSPAATRLFTWIDPDHWRRYHNPVQLLINVEPHHWERLLADPEFRRAYDAVIQALDAYRSRARWFDQHAGSSSPGPDRRTSPWSSASTSRWASTPAAWASWPATTARRPATSASRSSASGLLYRSGYFRQTVDADGFQQHIYPDYDFARLPVLPVQAPGGGVLTVPVDLPGRVVQAAVWKAQVGRVPVLMLDTDIPLNDPADRPITGILYVRGREMRLCQEIVLGVGGVRALRALGIWPVGLAHERGPRGLPRPRARARARAARRRPRRGAEGPSRGTRSSPPTPRCRRATRPSTATWSRQYLEPWTQDVGCDAGGRALRLGMEGGSFNLTVLAIRLSSQRQRREQAARRRSPRPCGGTCGRTRPERPVGHVTNGVHTQTWIGPEMRSLYAHHLGADWEDHLLEPEYWSARAGDPRRRALGRAPLAEGAAHPLRARARAHAERAPRPLARRAARGGGPARPARPHHRLRPPLRHLQARGAGALRPRPPARAARATARGRCRSSSRARPIPPTAPGQDFIRQLVPPHPGRVPGQDRVPRGLRHGGRPHARAGLRRVAQHAAPAAGGQRHQRAEVPDQRRDQPAASSTAGGSRATAATTAGPSATRDVDRRPARSRTARTRPRSTASSRRRWCRCSSTRARDGLRRRWIAMMKNSIASVVPQFSAHRMVRDYVEQMLPARARGQHEASLRRNRDRRANSASARSGRDGSAPSQDVRLEALARVVEDLVQAAALGDGLAEHGVHAAPRSRGSPRGRPCATQAWVPSPVLKSSPTRTTKTRRRASGLEAGHALVERLLARRARGPRGRPRGRRRPARGGAPPPRRRPPCPRG